jgi:hypothetical protein
MDIVHGNEGEPTAFGTAGGDSRHCATAAFPEKDAILGMVGLKRNGCPVFIKTTKRPDFVAKFHAIHSQHRYV